MAHPDVDALQGVRIRLVYKIWTSTLLDVDGPDGQVARFDTGALKIAL